MFLMCSVVWQDIVSLKTQKLVSNFFAKALPKNVLVVMEATGYYHYRLAQFLDKNVVAVSVVNPLSVKRFIHLSPTSCAFAKA